MKKCFKCGEEKHFGDFYKHKQMKDGFLNKCKECAKADTKLNREVKAEYYKQYDAMRFQNDPKVKARHIRYQKTERGKQKRSAAKAKWVEENKEKRAAHVLLGHSIRSGRVSKPDKCEICGVGGRIHGHHEDYTKPLDVVWVCPQCHVDIHKGKQNVSKE